MMKAIICTAYGPPEVLRLEDRDRPVPGDHDVLVKVKATTCHIGDTRVRSFDVPFWQRIPFRLYLGIRRPKRSILGMELAGTVEETGKAVERFSKGDEVFATTGFEFGAHAQYVCLPTNAKEVNKGLVAFKPTNMSYEEAAAGVATGGLTALELLRSADLQPRQQVLVYGASGSVGVFAVQLAKHFGAEVTGVCSTRNVDVVHSLGADRVIDYTEGDFVHEDTRYDVIVDAVDKLPRWQGKKALKGSGKYLNAVKDTGAGKPITTEDLVFLKDLVEAGELKTVIDRTYRLEDMADAHRYVEQGHKQGHVVVTVSHERTTGSDQASSL
jgi:NADPH:quinone reductase-like Zn-dependent oxidoreductase